VELFEYLKLFEYSTIVLMVTDITSIPWSVRLSWLESAHLLPLFSAGDYHP